MDRKKKNILYILIPILAAALILGFAAVYYYFYYLPVPNLDQDSSENFVATDSPETVSPGDEITYTVNIKNSGNTEMQELSIRTPIPENTYFISASHDGYYDEGTSEVLIPLETIGPGNKKEVSIAVAVIEPCDDGTTIEFGDVVIEYISRSEKKSFTISQPIAHTVDSAPDLGFVSFDMVDKNQKDINSGDILQMDLVLENTGNMIARDVLIDVSLNENTRLLNASTDHEVQDLGTDYLSWSISSVDMGQEVSLTFEAMAVEGLKNGSEISMQADISLDDQVVDSISIRDEVKAYSDLSSSSVKVEDLNGGMLWAGDVLRYTIDIVNTGLDTAKDFTVFCPSPDYTFYVSGSGTPENISWSDEIRGIRWDIGQGLGIGEEISLTLDFNVSSELTGGGTIEEGFYIVEGDRRYDLEKNPLNVSSYIFQTIVAMGDSHIVHTNWQNTLDSLLENTYPRAEFNTIGSGVPQEMAYQGVRRFDSTVAIYGPQIIIIGYGTNDTGGGINLFRNGLDELVKKAKSTGATVLVHSIGYIDTSKRPAKKSFLSYNAVIREVCSANGVPYVDLYTPMAADPGRYLDSDGMHWSAEGGSLLGHLVYNTLVGYLDAEGRRK